MKKIITLLMVLALAVSLLSGCFGIPKNISQAIQSAAKSSASASASSSAAEEPAEPDTQDASESEESSAPASLTAANSPSEGYLNYINVKSDAIERITNVAESSDELAMTVTFAVLGYSMMDLSLIWLTLFTDDMTGSEAAMAMLGMQDVKITANGSDYTITYKDGNDVAAKQTCHYDVGKDQLTSTLYDENNKITMFFEYVNLGENTYAAQYYYPSDDKYQVVRAYFDTTDVAAFGTESATDEPASIIGKSGMDEDFAKNGESYIIFKNGKLTAFDNGTTTTN
jgi:hypothetical protein